MIQKIKNLITAAALTMSLAVPVALPAVASAALTQNNITNGLCDGVKDATDTGTDCFNQSANGTGTLHEVARKVVNLFSIIVGIVAVIMIIYGGFRYITSGGESGRVGNAKNTLIYAIIGLIIVALAQFIVHFVLTNTSDSVNA